MINLPEIELPLIEHTPYEIIQCMGFDYLSFTGRLLDIGCGRYAKFVEFLRTRQINAEGIDPRIDPECSYLMCGEASAIPRLDDYFDYAMSHYSAFRTGIKIGDDPLCSHLIDLPEFRTTCDFVYSGFRDQLVKTLFETLRVLRSGGRFVIYPSPMEMLDKENHIIRERADVTYEIVDADKHVQDFRFRAVLTKL